MITGPGNGASGLAHHRSMMDDVMGPEQRECRESRRLVREQGMPDPGCTCGECDDTAEAPSAE